MKQLTLVQLEDLAHKETPNEVLLETNLNTKLHIKGSEDTTVISFPFGNKFDIIDGCIIVHKK